MAVKKPLGINDFYRRHHRRSLAVVIIFQFVSAAVLAGALIVGNVLMHQQPIFWMLIGLTLIVGLAVNIIALGVIIEPVKAITAALSYVAGEKSAPRPPNPNTTAYVHDGTKSMLDLIYGLTLKQDGGEATGSETQEHTSDPASKGKHTLESALTHSASSVVILSPDNQIIYSSPTAPVRTNPKGKKSLDLMFDSGDVSFDYWLEDCRKDKVESEKIWTRVHTNPDSAEEPRIFDIAASYSRDSETEVTLVFQDRTDQYEPDEKDLDFIAFAAHELRGPITVIKGYLDVFDDELGESLTEEQQTLLGRLVVSSNRLSTYINNILNVSRYDKKHYRVDLTEQRLFDIYDAISHDMEMRASTLGRILAVDLPHDLPTVAADANSITEVFANLVDNAIKYSNEGGIIKVSAELAGDFVEIEVTDNGIGMPDSVVHNLFHKFYRSHRSREQVAGSGIGLYISKAIVESHGGTISVRSSENKGSTFTFSLPLYSTVAEKLKSSDNGNNEKVIKTKSNWISNHNMYRG